jgi:PadR family transcriptional regulator PadR
VRVWVTCSRQGSRRSLNFYFSDIVYHIDVPDPGLGEFEQLVLLTLARQGPDAYGVSIATDIAERAKRDVSLGAVYKTLERLELKGLVKSALGLPTAERGGRRKKHYQLSIAGQRALKHSLAALRRMTAGLEAELEL